VHLYDSTIPSGEAYKIRLMLAQLALPYQTTELDMSAMPPETQSAAFLAKNPHGLVPVLQLDDGQILTESGAILFYLAEGTRFLPEARFARAQTLRWMFFEQRSHAPYLSVLEAWTYRNDLQRMRADAIQQMRVHGQAAIDLMETHLESHAFFAGEHYSIADIALFAYTQSADKIGLRTGSAIKAWMARVRSQPGHIPIKTEPMPKGPQLRWS
jgi:glutathione S-transferase